MHRQASLKERDTGRTFYVVHRHGDPADIVCAVESIAKTALVKAPGDLARPTKAYGVAAVFTTPAYRGQGMAAWMLRQLQGVMDLDSAFSVLYSGIGPDFYAKYGWDATLAARVTLFLLGSALTARLNESPENGSTRVAFLPTFAQVDWQFERNAIVARQVRNREPQNYGAATSDGANWIYWVHEVGRQTLGIIRIVGENPAAIMDLLRAALSEAKDWGFERVTVWNPQGDVEEAARMLGVEDETAVRVLFEGRQDRLPCLRWKGGEQTDVVWEDNHHYAWC
ncbi:unnamed protein product [Parascedosporium putredinis]|uniref:LYC1 C-terminal domain-containing protein n=1 Tax=Parascedosporium putredinis TaxID=1442378 RepID=A0A9P1H3F2_9PEZI|nr:unnamed protein product [Parascedosporium putredinis]CAI7994754.1 unnamed protein product [Parascedosporium putredinis]